MVTSTRIKANALKLSIDGTDYWADFSSTSMQSEDASADANTFYDASLGGRRDWFFTVSGVQSTESTSFWMAAWNDAGSEVAYVYAPHGNATASSSQPHWTGTLRLPARGSFILGGDASTDGTFSFDGVRIDIIGEPVLDTTP